MDNILALRPFVPARDLAQSIRFYQTLGFTLSGEEESVAFLKLENFSFILQRFYVKELAENFMMQMLVRQVDPWWAWLDTQALVAEFGVRPPSPPAMQPWGLRVAFIVDPTGVLWHIAEAKF
jgi:catechol 2,3-dioxygenase-like lactoylglutathione lyase family enzyme